MNDVSHGDVSLLQMQIIQGRLDSVIKEMSYKLIRSSYSSIVRESEDMGAAIFTLDGRELCESETTPMMIGTMVGFMKGMLKAIEERNIVVREGDALIHNHPYYGASHASDIGVITPIFYKGKQVAWSATAAHHCDTGAYLPGFAISTPDMYGESTYFLGQKLYDQGKKCEDLWHLLADNVRVPREVIGDLAAQVGACRIGEERFRRLLDDHGVEKVRITGDALLDYAERFMRAQIQKIPDGVYEAMQYCDSDGVSHEKTLPVKVKITIEGGDIYFDLTGSADQVPTARNVPFEGSTCTAIKFACRAVFCDQALFTGFIPQNSGVFEPIKIYAPLGSMFNPKFPAACNDRFNQIEVLADTILKALSPVVDLCAGTSACCNVPSYAGVDQSGNYWVFVEVNEGAYGGSARQDGMSAVDVLVANTQNSPIEYLEMDYPIKVTRYEYDVDAGTGAGKHRGGFGIIRNNQWTAPIMSTMLGDRGKQRPWGANGGGEGSRTGFTHVRADGTREQLPTTFEGRTFGIGDSIEIRTPSGGGWGNPRERDPKLVLQDYLNELITKEAAETVYSVAIHDDGIDEARTRSLRS